MPILILKNWKELTEQSLVARSKEFERVDWVKVQSMLTLDGFFDYVSFLEQNRENRSGGNS